VVLWHTILKVCLHKAKCQGLGLRQCVFVWGLNVFRIA